jgi:hypothetical protein
VQYYIEARDAAGALVARSGRSTAPNLITIEPRAVPQYDATMADDGTDAPVTAEPRRPLPPPIVVAPHPASGPPFSLTPVKWIATGVAGALLGTALVSYGVADSQHDRLLADSKSCGTPPCREFDAAHAHELQVIGERYDTVYKVTLIAGVVVASAAGYLWYRDSRSHKRRDRSVAVTPAVGDHFVGLTAAGNLW